MKDPDKLPLSIYLHAGLPFLEATVKGNALDATARDDWDLKLGILLPCGGTASAPAVQRI